MKKLHRNPENTARQRRLLKRISLALFIAPAVIAGWYFYYSAPLRKIPRPDLQALEAYPAEKIRQAIQMVEKSPRSGKAWGRLGMVLFVHDFKREAISCYEQAIVYDPGQLNWHYYLGIALEEINNEAAIQQYTRAVAIDTGYLPLRYRLGRALLTAGNSSEAAVQFQIVATRGKPELAAYGHWALGEIAYAAGKLDSARHHLEQAVANLPELKEARSLLATVYEQLGDTEAAVAEREQLDFLPIRLPIEDPLVARLEAQGASARWLGLLGKRRLDEGDVRAAIDFFEKQVRVRPDAEAYNNLGIAYQYANRHIDAASAFRKAIALKNDYAEAFNNLAVSLYSLGARRAAEDSLRAAVAIKPRYTEPYLNLGTFALIEGETKKAAEIFSRALLQAGYDIRIAARLAWLRATSSHAAVRDGQEAVELAEQVCRKTGFRRPEYIDILAAAMAEKGHFEKAITYARRALALATATGNRRLRMQIAYRLAQYQKHLPYRDAEL